MKTFQTCIKTIFFISLAFSFSQTFAALDSFKVTIDPESAAIWEALDVTIEAVDKSGETVTDYIGTIIVFSETDKEAEFPNELSENTYEFSPSDGWIIKFENAVKFKNPGKQSIHVYDLADDTVMWMAEVDITASDEPTVVDISLVSPENGITIGTNSVKVSGTTKKNHRVVITIDNSEEISTTSNSEWMFKKEVSNLQDGQHTFQASVLDADNKKVGESNIVSVRISASAPKLLSIKVTPVDQVEAESEVSVEVISDKWLSSVWVIINDVLTSLQETKEWVYLGKTRAPKEEWLYAVDVTLKSELWIETKEMAVAQLNVTPALNAPEQETNTWTVQEPTVEMKAPDMLDPLRITGLKLTELKTKSVLTWDPVAKASGYNVYKRLDDGKLQLVETVKDPSFTVNITGEEIKHEYFYVRAIGNDDEGASYEWDLSDATKIQTGPEMYIILALISIILVTLYFMFKRRMNQV